MRSLTTEQFGVYARRQIAAADDILGRHGRLRGDLCGCGRLWPCPVVATCVQMREHFLARLALIEATTRLPVVSPGRVQAPAAKAAAWRLGTHECRGEPGTGHRRAGRGRVLDVLRAGLSRVLGPDGRFRIR
ncbi:hypothetical protein Cci01nite_36440 [Catellatospora citrea]|uniref:Uncharacterized protein n=1 Tax=Catellatospora citrea TaxID=53366 RepID=A0A8J3KK92_9ACTN|nr:hypothetical protein Cci01nite_36440 [Catellatospora citrea]